MPGSSYRVRRCASQELLSVQMWGAQDATKHCHVRQVVADGRQDPLRAPGGHHPRGICDSMNDRLTTSCEDPPVERKLLILRSAYWHMLGSQKKGFFTSIEAIWTCFRHHAGALCLWSLVIASISCCHLACEASHMAGAVYAHRGLKRSWT